MTHIDDLVDALEKHNDWTFTPFEAIHYPSKVKIWIANGYFFYEVTSPIKVSFGLIGKFRIMKAVRKCRNKKLRQLLNLTIR